MSMMKEESDEMMSVVEVVGVVVGENEVAAVIVA